MKTVAFFLKLSIIKYIHKNYQNKQKIKWYFESLDLVCDIRISFLIHYKSSIKHKLNRMCWNITDLILFL